VRYKKHTANKIFAMRFLQVHDKRLVLRAFFLCRALYKKMHGKQALCRAPQIK
jgi:hypothetical protein